MVASGASRDQPTIDSASRGSPDDCGQLRLISTVAPCPGFAASTWSMKSPGPKGGSIGVWGGGTCTGGKLKSVATSWLASGLTAKDSSCCGPVMANVVTWVTVPSGARER